MKVNVFFKMIVIVYTTFTTFRSNFHFEFIFLSFRKEKKVFMKTHHYLFWLKGMVNPCYYSLGPESTLVSEPLAMANLAGCPPKRKKSVWYLFVSLVDPPCSIFPQPSSLLHCWLNNKLRSWAVLPCFFLLSFSQKTNIQ